MKFAIIYHIADFDGKLSNEVCRFHINRLYPDSQIDSYGWDYGQPDPSPKPNHEKGLVFGMWTDYDQIYIVDLSCDGIMQRPDLGMKIVWIDHHKTAIDKWDAGVADERLQPPFKGLRIDGVAACRLCWNWFHEGEAHGAHIDKQSFVDRKVSEPLLIRLAGEYDVWDLRDDRVKPLQFGLRALKEDDYRELINQEFKTGEHKTKLPMLEMVLDWGYMIKLYSDKNNSEYAEHSSQTINWEGLTFCALNIGQRGNSDLLNGGLKAEHQACFAWRWSRDHVLVSLYHIAGHTDLDLSKIAVKYGGGGHRGACGFKLNLKQLSEILETPVVK